MARILSGVLAEEVAKELLEDAPLPEILPVILAVLTLHNVQLESESSFLVTMVRQKSEINIMCKIFFIFQLL
ncbi:MAG TPA: hypothetical protein DF909_08550 [Deltaproteobacteria bacterium]|nr:hypothetical protein [Deltaproteobacteria bacterium]